MQFSLSQAKSPRLKRYGGPCSDAWPNFLLTKTPDLRQACIGNLKVEMMTLSKIASCEHRVSPSVINRSELAVDSGELVSRARVALGSNPAADILRVLS